MLGRLACLAFAALVVSGRWAGDVAATPHSYPSTPFSPGASPTALALPQPDDSRPAGWRDPIWVAVPGHVLELKTRRDGSLAPMANIRLPVGVSVTALAASEAGEFFLDATHGRVLVYESGRLVHTLATGPEPVGLVAGDEDAGGPFVIVANAGSADLSVYESTGPTFGRERRVRLGVRPSAIVGFDELGGSFAVASTEAGTVTAFSDPTVLYPLKRLRTVHVGGAPAALAVAAGLTSDLNDDFWDDLVVGDAMGGPATELLSLIGPRRLRLGPTFSTGPADAMAVANLDRDAWPDVAVGDRTHHRLAVVHGRPEGFSAPVTVAARFVSCSRPATQCSTPATEPPM